MTPEKLHAKQAEMRGKKRGAKPGSKPIRRPDLEKPRLPKKLNHQSKENFERNRLLDIQALRLRAGGMSYPEITLKLGYSSQASCYKRVQTCLASYVKEPAAKVRNVELYRLDSMLRVLWSQGVEQILGPLMDPTKVRTETLKNIPGVNVQIIDRIIHVMERRAKYLGLDAPTKIAPTDPTGKKPFLSDEERMRRVMQMLGKGLERTNGPMPNEVLPSEPDPTETQSGDLDGGPVKSGLEPTE